MLQSVSIPDVLPSALPSGSDFSLVAGLSTFHATTFCLQSHSYLGDFEEIYGAEEGNEKGQEPQSGQWDAILTCFFIDTVSSAAT